MKQIFYFKQRIFQFSGFFLAMSLVATFAYVGCQKDIPVTTDEQISEPVETTERTGDEIVTYYLNGQVISAGSYEALPLNYYRHDYITANAAGTAILKEANAFSTKALYEAWGVIKGIQVNKMNLHDERVDFLADSLGITAMVLANQTPPSDTLDYYLSQIEQSYNTLFGTASTSPVSYKGCEFFTNDCAPGSPGCNNATAAFLPVNVTLPTWVHFPIYLFMEDNSEAWKPKCFLPNPSGYKVTLRPYTYPFYVTLPWQSWVKKATVSIPANQNELFVPFKNNLNVWKNRISSWMIFPGL